MGTTTESAVMAAEFVLSMANGRRSVEAVQIKDTSVLKAGAVLGAVAASGAEAAAVAITGNTTGLGTIGAITVTGPARLGRYTAVVTEPATNAGAFELRDPNGAIVGKGNIGSAFSGGGLAFTWADATDAVAGDGYYIDVTGSYEYVEWNPAGTDGSENVGGILWADADATDAAVQAAAVVRDAEVKADMLVWKTGATAPQKAAGTAALAKLGIIAR